MQSSWAELELKFENFKIDISKNNISRYSALSGVFCMQIKKNPARFARLL